MRPRVFPAEDLGIESGKVLVEQASMRPRVFPAEDVRNRRAAFARDPALQ